MNDFYKTTLFKHQVFPSERRFREFMRTVEELGYVWKDKDKPELGATMTGADGSQYHCTVERIGD